MHRGPGPDKPATARSEDGGDTTDANTATAMQRVWSDADMFGGPVWGPANPLAPHSQLPGGPPLLEAGEAGGFGPPAHPGPLNSMMPAYPYPYDGFAPPHAGPLNANLPTDLRWAQQFPPQPQHYPAQMMIPAGAGGPPAPAPAPAKPAAPAKRKAPAKGKAGAKGKGAKASSSGEGSGTNNGKKGSDAGSDEGEEDLNDKLRRALQEAELDPETNSGEIKKIKRMLSNRESARRSRRRKQAHLNDLEVQVGQLQVENGQMMSRINDLTQSYQQAVSENRNLKATLQNLVAKLHQLEGKPPAAAGAAGGGSNSGSDSQMANGMFLPDIDPAQGEAAVAALAMHSLEQRALLGGGGPASYAMAAQSGLLPHGLGPSTSVPYAGPPVPHLRGAPAAGPGGNVGGGLGLKMERTESMQQLAEHEHSSKRTKGAAAEEPAAATAAPSATTKPAAKGRGKTGKGAKSPKKSPRK